MKKIILSVFFAMIGIFANVNAQTRSASSNSLIPNLSLGNYLGSNVTSGPNSTQYPGYYEVNLKVTTNPSTCYANFSFLCERRVQGSNIWGTFTPSTPFPFAGQLMESYTGTAKVLQYQGTVYEYRVKVTYNPTGNVGTSCSTDPTLVAYTPIRTATVIAEPIACFTMPYFVQSTQNEPSYYGPMPVKTICINGVLINGSCSQFEQGYHIRVAEFNLSTWTFVDDLYSNWVSATAEAPSYISLNALAAQNNKYFEPGKLYIVDLSIGPVWKSAGAQFFRVTNTCKSSETVPRDVKEISNEDIPNLEVEENLILSKLELFPNPVKDNLTLSINRDEKIISYTIYDNSGFLVKKEEFKSKLNEQEINLNDLRKGFYIINIESDKGSYKDKIIKE